MASSGAAERNSTGSVCEFKMVVQRVPELDSSERTNIIRCHQGNARGTWTYDMPVVNQEWLVCKQYCSTSCVAATAPAI